VSSAAAAIATAGLTKDYGGAPALGPLDLVVPAGQRVSLIGHNGSGKTTLIRLLTGMLEPTGGTASVNGHPAGSIEARAALAHLADQPVFYDDLSVREHLEYVARFDPGPTNTAVSSTSIPRRGIRPDPSTPPLRLQNATLAG
jgi:ABC-type multidrug transport system ATPase subunit